VFSSTICTEAPAVKNGHIWVGEEEEEEEEEETYV
jgi:hypothetical protein